jgi:aldose sugar dehydrogenase
MVFLPVHAPLLPRGQGQRLSRLRALHCAVGMALGLALPLVSGAQERSADVAQESTAGRALPPGGDCTPGPYAADTFVAPPAFPHQTAAPIVKESAPYRVEVIHPGLHNPRSLEFIGEGNALVSVWPGELRVLSRDLSAPIAGLPALAPGRDGGFDIALDPDFATNRTIFLLYRIVKPGQVPQPGKRPEALSQIARARLSLAADRMEDWKVIYEGGYLRRIVVARDGTLIFTSLSAEGEASRALDDPNGKVLRINRDGSIPKNNPFVGKAGARGEIYALGHRDVDGVTLDGRGRIWTIEHGPRGGDELNRIEPGKDYGYPLIGYGQTYKEEPINGGKTSQKGLEQPVYYWSRDTGPAGLIAYSGKMFPKWKGDFFFGSLAQRRLERLDMDRDKVIGVEYFLTERCQRVRDVAEAPDGSLYVLTNSMKSDGLGEVLRITAP